MINGCFYIKTISQIPYPGMDSIYLFWQSDRKITFEEYQGTNISNDVFGAIALWSVLDLPEHQTILKPGQAKVYFAPVFIRDKSRASTNDSIKIAIDNIYFDILELSARKARMKYSLLPDSVIYMEELSKLFQCIVKEMHENRLKMIRKFHREVFRDHKENGLLSWKFYLEQELENSTKWTTQSDDCKRFLQNCPIVKGYVEDEKSNPLLLFNYEQVLGRSCWHSEFCQISRFRK